LCANNRLNIPPQSRKGIEGFDKELADLHPIISFSPSINYEKIIIPHSIKKHKALALGTNNKINLSLQGRKGIDGFNKELADLHPILSPSPLIKYEKLVIPHSINERKPLDL